MRQLVIRFISEHGLVSDLIDWRTDSLWCHTEALSRDGKSWIGAHASTGVQARPLNWCKPTREAIYAIPVTPQQYEAAMGWLESKIHEPYNFESIFGLAIALRCTDDHSTDCSALMFGYMLAGGQLALNVLEGYEYLVTPETLHLSPVFVGRRIKDVAQIVAPDSASVQAP